VRGHDQAVRVVRGTDTFPARRDAVCCSVRCRQARHRFLRAAGYVEQVPGRPLMLSVAGLATVPLAQANRLLAGWGHDLGPVTRPFGQTSSGHAPGSEAAWCSG
jgi:hypothetical protein